jgi:arabinofuranosyltransferase
MDSRPQAVAHDRVYLMVSRALTRTICFWIAASVGIWQAWTMRFVQDDAYISFRYAENLVRGHGLVWNVGERVEGYTNFLWTLLLVIPHAIGWDVESFAIGLGLVLFTATLAVFYALTAGLTGSWITATAATLTLGAFPTFAAFATGGLETQLQAFLVVVTLSVVIREIRANDISAVAAGALGTSAALAVLTRIDSVVLILPMLAVYVVVCVSRLGWRRAFLSPATAVPLSIWSAWLAWKLAYYGAILPNSYQAKVEGLGDLTRQGARFVVSFVQAYSFYLPLACVPAGAWLAWERRIDRRAAAAILIPLMLWTAYVVSVGGDFMEYRFLVSSIPLAFLLTYWVMSEIDGNRARAALVTTLVLAGGALTYRSKVPKPPGSPLPLRELAVTSDQEWYEVGTVLHDAFQGSVRPSIAVIPAGVIPYRSQLRSVDMLGLNDPDVRSFIHLPYELVGHRRLAPLALLEKRGINFLIGSPFVRTPRPLGMRFRYDEFARRPYAYSDEHRLKGRTLIEMPLPHNRILLMVYLTEDPALTLRLDQLGWRRYALE